MEEITIKPERKKIAWIALLVFIGGFVLIQFWPRDFTNPPVGQVPQWDSPETRELAERACFDCHSNETEWPWYAYVMPMASMIERDVKQGRRILNFSEWDASCCTEERMDEMAEVVNKGLMPLPYYVILHPEADLTDEERGRLVNGLISTMRRDAPGRED